MCNQHPYRINGLLARVIGRKFLGGVPMIWSQVARHGLAAGSRLVLCHSSSWDCIENAEGKE